MAAPEELGSVAAAKQPIYYNDPAVAWEQRLQQAYDEATQHLQATLAPGQVINTAEYETASDVANVQMDQFGGTWNSSIKSWDPRTASPDVPQDQGLGMPSEQMRQFYLGRYAQASSNLGAYLTGYAREQIPIGSITQQEFDTGAEMRLRAFSDIIDAGRRGALKGLVAGESYAQGADPARIAIRGDGTHVTQGTSTQGLGFDPATGTIIALSLLAVVMICGCVYILSNAVSNYALRVKMLQQCQDARDKGDPKADKICADMTQIVAKTITPDKPVSPLDNVFGAGTGQKIVTYAAIGVGAYLLITFAPDIIRSLRKSKDAFGEQEKMVENMARWRRRYAR